GGACDATSGRASRDPRRHPGSHRALHCGATTRARDLPFPAQAAGDHGHRHRRQARAREEGRGVMTTTETPPVAAHVTPLPPRTFRTPIVLAAISLATFVAFGIFGNPDSVRFS